MSRNGDKCRFCGVSIGEHDFTRLGGPFSPHASSLRRQMGRVKRRPHSHADLFVGALLLGAITAIGASKGVDASVVVCGSIALLLFVLAVVLPTEPRRPVPRRFRR